MLNTKLDFSNYRAKVVRIERLEPHPNADKLLIAVVDYQRIIVGLDTKIGDLFIYFPLECQINGEFISFINGYSDPNLNRDKTKKQFFSGKRRVKATRLRGELSEGYLHPAISFNDFLVDSKIKFQISERDLGVEFDSVGDLLICNKYIIKEKGLPSVKKEKEAKVLERLIDGQLRLHKDTENFKRNLHKVGPEDIISCSYKIHGTNFSFAKVLCKKRLKWYEKVLKKIGVNIVDFEYDWVAASRRVVKSLESAGEKAHFYEYDLWSEAMHRIKDKIEDGIILYGEIAGSLASGSFIQKNYDYSAKPNDYRIFVFRMTYTDHKGKVFEFTRPQIDRYCKKYELETAPLFYYGKAKDMYPELDVENHWHENFLANLIRDYTEKDCYMCRNSVPEEGCVIVKEGEVWEGFKIKSSRFLLEESAELDSGATNIEDVN